MIYADRDPLNVYDDHDYSDADYFGLLVLPLLDDIRLYLRFLCLSSLLFMILIDFLNERSIKSVLL